ncbi:hypothetical protein EHS25_010144 [Saitozyma podzolica]|uniref:Rad60/SUMO-like domain-containing protein n=1 Tax=Saitozyma podzolica TaxID=1890683 RepID=A0A427YIQ5_9TREE|nr:hypothetical protein EHS25_010144 [Saitozyma podzolica]
MPQRSLIIQIKPVFRDFDATMRVLPTTKLESIMEAWADMYDLDKEDYRFLHGRWVHDRRVKQNKDFQTVQDAGMEDGDVIEVLVELTPF